MRRRQITILVILAIFIFCSYLLVTGSPLLEAPFLGMKGFPLGNAVAWALLISIPLLFWYVGNLRQVTSTGGKIIRSAVLIALVMAMLWGFVSRWMSGNWLFNFTNAPESARNPWYYYTAAIGALPVLAMVVYWLLRIIKQIRNMIGKK